MTMRELTQVVLHQLGCAAVLLAIAVATSPATANESQLARAVTLARAPLLVDSEASLERRIEQRHGRYIKVGGDWYLHSRQAGCLIPVFTSDVMVKTLQPLGTEEDIRAALSLKAVNDAGRATVRHILTGDRYEYYVLSFPGTHGMELVDQLANTGLFRAVAPDVGVCTYFDPNDPVSEENGDWHLEQILATDAWGITTGSSSVRIGVIDDGVDETHVTNSTTGDILNYDTACAPA